MMTILAFGSDFRRLATSSKMAFAVLSTRHGLFRSGNWMELALLQVGGGGGTSTPTVQVPVPVRLRASVAVTVTVIGPARRRRYPESPWCPCRSSVPALEYTSSR